MNQPKNEPEQQGKLSFHLTSEQVLNEIMDMEYKLPKQEEFLAELRTQKLSAMQVGTVSQPDIVTADKQAFLKYLRVSNIRGVMYAYSYYTESDLDRRFDLSAADKSFFSFVPQRMPGHYTHTAFGSVYFPPREIDSVPKETDFDQYLLYSKYIRLALDLSYPTRLDIYALHEGKLLCCRLEDKWLERLDLPHAQMFKAMFVGKGAERPSNGMIEFRFDYISGEEEEPAPEIDTRTESERLHDEQQEEIGKAVGEMLETLAAEQKAAQSDGAAPEQPAPAKKDDGAPYRPRVWSVPTQRARERGVGERKDAPPLNLPRNPFLRKKLEEAVKPDGQEPKDS